MISLLLPIALVFFPVPQTHQPPADTASCSNSIVCPGEDLLYEVSWFKVHLGQIRIRMAAPTVADGQVQYHPSAYIDSYEGLPFASLHAVNHTHTDARFYSRGFSSVEARDDAWISEKSHYDFPQKRLIIEKSPLKGKSGPPIGSPKFDTLNLPSADVEDGLSILFFARAHVRQDTADVRVPTIVYGKKGATVLRFPKRTEHLEIDAIKNAKVRVVPLEGKAEFAGMFGFTGEFKGWFSDDAAAVPIKAELKVIVGSVRLELVEWKRTGWSPR